MRYNKIKVGMKYDVEFVRDDGIVLGVLGRRLTSEQANDLIRKTLPKAEKFLGGKAVHTTLNNGRKVKSVEIATLRNAPPARLAKKWRRKRA